MGSRNSRTLTILLVVALVLVVAASLVTWSPRSSRPWTSYPTSEGTPEGSSAPRQGGEVSPCGWAWAPAPTVLVELPDGATRMWICDSVVRQPLTQGVQQVIDQIVAQPELDGPHRDCGPLADAGTVFVDYPDGTRVGFSWDTSCTSGGVAGRTRPGAAANAIRAAYQAQYGADNLPDHDDDPDPCRPRQFTRIESPVEALGSLTMCRGILDATHGAGATAAVALAPGDVVRVVAGLTPQDADEAPAPPSDAVLLRGVYSQGLAPNMATLWWSGDRIWTSQGSHRVKQLSAQGRAVLERYRRGHVPDPNQVGPFAWAGDSPCGAALETSSPDVLPDEPLAAWLCTNTSQGITAPPVPDPLTLDPQALVDVYSALPPVDDKVLVHCDLTPGPTYNLVMRYRNRDVVVAGSLWGCGWVGHRYGAGTMLQAFTTLLTQQRRTVAAPSVPPPTPGGPTTVDSSPCQGWGRWIPGRVDQLSWLVTCDQDAVSRVLPASVIVDLRSHSQLANARYDPRPASVTVVGLAPDGTQIRIEWDGVDGWYHVNEQWYRWRPSDAAKAALP